MPTPDNWHEMAKRLRRILTGIEKRACTHPDRFYSHDATKDHTVINVYCADRTCGAFIGRLG